MCMDMPDSPKSISGNNHLKTGMRETKEASKWRYLVIYIWPTIWTLQIWGSIKNNLPISCFKNNDLITQRNRARSLFTWNLGNSRKCYLVTKLCSILMMEADFNFVNKTIYGGRILDNVRKYNLMPEEIFSERNRISDDGTLAKVLFYDIVRQIRVSAGIS